MPNRNFRYETICLTPKEWATAPNLKELREKLGEKNGGVCDFSEQIRQTFRVPKNGVVIVYDTFAASIGKIAAIASACGYEVRSDIAVHTVERDFFMTKVQLARN